tara:strand:+ start:1615 stop:2667 length:1053 start_codon:yes stop_codon:yes gene_type:complete
MAYINFQPSDYFATKLYTGNGSTQTITTGLANDMVWLKGRSFVDNHVIFDSVRGTNKKLNTDTTAAEGTAVAPNLGVTAFNSTGFDLGAWGAVNGNTETFASWNWKAGTSTGLSFSAGDITPSAYSVNTTSGIGIYKYTGPGTVGGDTIAHNLGATPKILMVKRLSATYNWAVQHGSIANTNILNLNTPDVSAANDAFHNTYPTSTLITLGSSTYTNAAAGSSIYVCYAFAPVKGYSAIGSYIGNGNIDGPFIYTGFRPAFVMMKRDANSEDWHLYDDRRENSFNIANKTLDPNNTNAEYTIADGVDFLANGFKWRATASALNGSGSTHIYMAFAEYPLVSSNSKAGTAR